MKKASSSEQAVRNMIIAALSHSEAEDGLYFRNFSTLHQEDQRPVVLAEDNLILNELNLLIREGIVKVGYDQLETTFILA